MPITVGPISLNDLGEAFFSSAKANHLTNVPVYFSKEGPCGPLLVKGQAASSASGRAECTDLINPMLGYSYSYTGLLDPDNGSKIASTIGTVITNSNSYLATSAAIKTAYANAGYIQRGPDMVLLFPDGRIQDQIRVSTNSMLDACGGAIGFRRTIIHSHYAFDPTTCEYLQSYSEVFKFFWNESFYALANIQSRLVSDHLVSNASSMVSAAVAATFDNSGLSGDSYTTPV